MKSLEMRARILKSGFCEKSSALTSVRLPGFLLSASERGPSVVGRPSARRHNLVSVPEVTAVDDFYLWHAKRRDGIVKPKKRSAITRLGKSVRRPVAAEYKHLLTTTRAEKMPSSAFFPFGVVIPNPAGILQCR